ncbi:hypothetical protein [Nocardia sp. NBC_01377]|uniref:hypothetical protein n=1 Tax=Nocardia sp. NBC_01377 TaxID=2903595 RepID=UPI00386E73ED
MTERRMSQARRLLLDTDLSIGEISRCTGSGPLFVMGVPPKAAMSSLSSCEEHPFA